MNIKKSYSGIFTIIFFVLIVSSIVPVAALENKTLPEEDFSSPTAKGAVKAATTAPQASTGAVAASSKIVVYKGEVSATPSAIGKFLVKTNEGDKNVDTDKKTKVFAYDATRKTVTTVARLKVTDKVIVVGQVTTDGKSLLAQHILVITKKTVDQEKSALYGTVSNREASGSAFTISVKSPSQNDEEELTLNANTAVTVKDVEAPKLSDIKIGDRVTLTYYTQNNVNYATRVLAIPGRAAGLLREIRESSSSASTNPIASPTAAVKSAATTKPAASATPSASSKATTKPSATAKPSVTPKI